MARHLLSTGFNPKTRQAILERCEEMCERCGDAPAQQLHHRRPRASGGSKRADTNTPANAFAICSPCHAHVESHRDEALDNGWLVRQGCDPSTVPILYRGQLVLLFEDGSTELQ